MNLQDVDYINAICSHGSFVRAAKELGITQPTLSARIERIEKKISGQLFERGKGHSKPTNLAIYIAQQASPLLRQMDVINNEVLQLAGGKTGRLVVGLGPVTYKTQLLTMIKQYLTVYPNVNIEIIHNDMDAILHLLAHGKIDIAICQDTTQISALGLQQFGDHQYPIIAVCARTQTDIIRCETLQELFNYPAAIPMMNDMYRTHLREELTIDIDQLSRSIICSDYSFLIEMVVDSGFFSIGPDYVFAKELADGTLCQIPIVIPIIHNVTCVINPSMYFGKTKRNFINLFAALSQS